MIEVRPYQNSDQSDLEKIYQDSRVNTFFWENPKQFELQSFINDTENEVIWVATVNSIPVGFVAIWMESFFIHHLYLDKKYHGQGIGKKLLNKALEITGRPARLKCVVQNKHACQFYEANGWKIESTAPNGPMGPYHTYVFE